MKYLVTPAPHKYSRASINDMYITLSTALFACLLCGFFVYKMPAVYISLACIGSTFLTEYVLCAIKNKKFIVPDFSWLCTALVLSCIMPVNMPWYLGIVAGVVAICSKYLFGGLGNNLFNPAGLSRAVLGVLFANMSFDYFGGDTPLSLLLSGNKSLVVLKDLLYGNVVSAIGAGCIILLLVIAVTLLVLRLIKWENLLFAVGGYLLVIGLAMGGSYCLPMLLSGSFVFVCIFMLNDPTTSPYGFSARCLYALTFGVLAGVFAKYNIFGESSIFLALLLANFASPVFDNLTRLSHKGVKKHD